MKLSGLSWRPSRGTMREEARVQFPEQPYKVRQAPASDAVECVELALAESALLTLANVFPLFRRRLA